MLSSHNSNIVVLVSSFSHIHLLMLFPVDVHKLENSELTWPSRT